MYVCISNQNDQISLKTATAVLTEKGPYGKCVAFGFEAEEMFADTDESTYDLYTDFKVLLNDGAVE